MISNHSYKEIEKSEKGEKNGKKTPE